jgi:hypothetical protein
MIVVDAVLTYLVVEKPARNRLRSVRVFVTLRASETISKVMRASYRTSEVLPGFVSSTVAPITVRYS